MVIQFCLRQYGFDQWMINLIDAPAPTIRVLCKYHYLHNVLVAKDMSSQQIERVRRNGPVWYQMPSEDA